MGRIFSVILLLLLSVNVFGQTLYERLTGDAHMLLSDNTAPFKYSQTFTIGNTGTNESFVIDNVSGMSFTASSSGVINVAIYETSGGLPTSLVTSNSVTAGGLMSIDLPSAILTSSTMYAIVVEFTIASGQVSLNEVYESNDYTGGALYSYNGSSWVEQTDLDMIFSVYGHRNPTITTHPVSQTKCVGQSVTFTVGSDAVSPTYQWKKNGSNISGQTSSSYTISSVASSDAANYTCTVTESALGVSTTSNAATLTVPTTTSISSHPSSISRCTGTSATFSVTAAGSGLTYQWKKNGSNISGQTASSYTISSVATGDAADYTVTVTGTCGTVTSSAAVLTVNTAPSITDHPDNLSLCIGDNATFSVTATGSGLTYQWMKDESAISGATSSSYTIPGVDATHTGVYNCIIHGTCAMSMSYDATLTLGTSTLLNDLVSYYGFNGTGTYTTEYDEHGINNGAVTNVERIGSEAVRLSYGNFNSNTDYITLTTPITQSTGSYSFWLYPTDRSDDRLIMANNVYYSRIYLTINGYVRVETNTNNQEFVFSTNAVPLNTWSHVVLTRLGDVMKYYLNGTYIGSVTVTSAAALTLGQIGFNSRSFRGNIDEIGIWSRELNSDEVSELYNTGLGIVYSTMGDCGTTPPVVPVTGRKKYLIGKNIKSVLLANIIRDLGGVDTTTTPEEPEEDIIYYLQENFETWVESDVDSKSSLSTKLPMSIQNYNGASYHSIQDVGGDHNKVWQIMMPEDGHVAYNGYIHLGDTARELYYQYDLYVQSDFDKYSKNGIASGKLPGGFAMGNSLSGDTDTTSVTGIAGHTHNVWGTSADQMLYSYDHVNFGYACGACGTWPIPRGYWQTKTIRLNVGTPGQYNGFAEMYIDGVLDAQFTGLKFRSITQGEDFGKIEALFNSYQFGGGGTYLSPKNQYIRWDNLVVYKLTPTSEHYVQGLATTGRTIPILPITGHIVPDTRLHDEVYTNATDTIYDVGVPYIYNPPNSYTPIYKTVNRPSGSISFTFLSEEFGYSAGGVPYKVEVYEGSVSTENLRYTFGNTGDGYTNPTGSYTIENSTVIFVFRVGDSNYDKRGVAIRYWQP